MTMIVLNIIRLFLIIYCLSITVKYGYCEPIHSTGHRLYFERLRILYEDKERYAHFDNLLNKDNILKYVLYTQRNTYTNLEVYKILYRNCILGSKELNLFKHPIIITDQNFDFIAGHVLSRSNYGNNIIITDTTLVGEKRYQRIQTEKIFMSKKYTTMKLFEDCVKDPQPVLEFKFEHKNRILDIVNKYK